MCRCTPYEMARSPFDLLTGKLCILVANLTVANVAFNVIRDIIILTKISKFTVNTIKKDNYK